MTKAVDVDFRIRAKNLSRKELREINSDIERLTENQKKQASAADLAATSARDLAEQHKALSAATREITRRRDLVQQFSDQRDQIGKTAAKLQELTALYREMNRGSGGSLIGFNEKQLRETGREVINVEKQLRGLVAQNKRTGESLAQAGVNTKDLVGEFVSLSASADRAETALKVSERAINSHTAATAHNAEVQREATRRLAEERNQVEQNISSARALAAETDRIAKKRADSIAAFTSEAEVQKRASIIAEEVSRRTAADTVQRTRNWQEIRKQFQEEQRLTQMRRDAVAAFGPEMAAQERGNAIRERLVALLNTERGQRILTAEAQRREVGSLNQNTSAHDKNNASVRKGAEGIKLFSDTGRKSLSTYQRLRGQVLGLAAAYIGFYQAINTFQKSIAATTRNDALKVGLRTVNNGDARGAADDYRFLREEADRLGLVFDDIAPKFANMAIAGKAVGLTGKQIRDVFSDVATSVAAGNLSVDDSEGVFKAIVQIMSKARVQAEELRGQLGDRLPGAVVKFAQANNIALTDLDAKLKKGEIGIGFLIKGIQGYADQYDSSLDAVTTRLQAYINRATNSYNDFLRSLLSGENDQKIKNAFERISAFFRSKDGKDFAASLAKGVGALADLLILLAKNFDKVQTAVKAFIAVQVLKFLSDIVFWASSAAFKIGGLIKTVLLFTTAVEAGTPIMAAFNLALGAGTAKAAGEAGTALNALRFGPLAALLAIAATGIVIAVTILYNSEKETQNRQGTVKDTLANLNRGFGESERALSNTEGKNASVLKSQIDAAQQLIDVSEKRSAALRKEIDTLEAKSKVERSAAASTGTNDHAVLRNQQAARAESERQAEVLRTQLLLTEQRAQQLKGLVKDRTGDLAKLEKAEAEAAAKALAELNKPKPAKPKPPKTEAQLRSEENARLNAERAIQKEILNIDQETFDARIDGENKTAEQIEKNYELKLRKIQSQIEEQLLNIDKLEQASRTANSGVVPAADAAAIKLLRDKVAVLQQVQNARALEDADVQKILLREQAINDLVDKRNNAIALANTMKEVGAITDSEAYQRTLQAQNTYNGQIRELSADLISFLEKIDPTSDLYTRLGVDKVINGLRLVNAEAVKLTLPQQFARAFGPEIADGIASTFGALMTGIGALIQRTGSLGDAFRGAWDAFRQFASSFLMEIAQMIIKAWVLYAIQVATGTAGATAPTFASIFAPKQHKGGIAGRDSSGTARVNPMVFAGAQRFHEGGLPGLRQGEVATILQKGEEVLTENDPRHIGNGGGAVGGKSPVNIKQVVLHSTDDLIGEIANTPKFQKVLVTAIGKNSKAILAGLGLGNGS
jgi:tape measure domain-containing protein